MSRNIVIDKDPVPLPKRGTPPIFDVNQLSDRDIVERTGLMQIVHQPTRGANVLDRVYLSNRQVYSNVRVVTSVVRSGHKAVVAYSDRAPQTPKTTTQHTCRCHTPAHSMLSSSKMPPALTSTILTDSQFRPCHQRLSRL